MCRVVSRARAWGWLFAKNWWWKWAAGISVDSTPGRGSVFSFDIGLEPAEAPAGDKLARSDPDADKAAASLDRARILVVEDNAVNQAIFTAMLDKAGCAADVVGDGNAAIEAVKLQHYDLVLMDVHMPGIDGVTACRRIRDHGFPADRLPIVAVTADAMPEDHQAYLAAGMNGLVAKPIDRSSLMSAIRRYVPENTVQ